MNLIYVHTSQYFTYGCFQKRRYPQIIHFNRVFHYKPSILGYPYFWKHPYIMTCLVEVNLQKMIILHIQTPLHFYHVVTWHDRLSWMSESVNSHSIAGREWETLSAATQHDVCGIFVVMLLQGLWPMSFQMQGFAIHGIVCIHIGSIAYHTVIPSYHILQ